MNRRHLIPAASVATALILLVAFFTNPDQAAHLKAIKETAALRSNPDILGRQASLNLVQYQNYFFFSITTIGGLTTTRGYFGKVETTNNMSLFF